MKYFIYRLEITDGEHGYYSSHVCKAESIEDAIKSAGENARDWYEVPDHERHDITELGQYPTYSFPYHSVICEVDQVEEIPESDFEILSKYPAYL